MSTIVDASTIVANDPDPPILGDMLRASANDAIASAAPRVISPQGVPGEAAGEQHGDFLQSLFANDPDAVRDNIPSQHMFPIIQEPPFDPVHFNVPNPNRNNDSKCAGIRAIGAIPVHRHTRYS